MFHKGQCGTVEYIWSPVLWGGGRGCSIKAGGVPCSIPDVQCCGGGRGVFHENWFSAVWYTRCAVLWVRGDGVFHKGWWGTM